MPQPLSFLSPSGKKMYAAAQKERDGWVVRLFDQAGEQISPIVFRVCYETEADETIAELPTGIIVDLMNEMRRQIMAREAAFLIRPIRTA